MVLASVLSGVFFGLSLIVAIGAQNAFVLRQGILGTHVFAVVAFCALSDALLIGAGVAGLGVLIEAYPAVLVVARWGGAAFLVAYGLFAARRAVRGGNAVDEGAGDVGAGGGDVGARGGDVGAGGTGGAGASGVAGQDGVRRESTRGLFRVLLTVAALTWLNPHVYLDTVLLLGSIANTHGETARWYFAGGAMLASVLWFALLGYGARYLRPVFARPQAWRVLDGVIALTLFLIAAKLIFGEV